MLKRSKDSERPADLLPRIGSERHNILRGFVWVGVTLSGALALVAATSHESWTVLVVVGLIALTGVIGAATWITQPVRQEHAMRLRDSAGNVLDSVVNGGRVRYDEINSPLARRMFRVHFGRLAAEADAWDRLVAAKNATRPDMEERIEDALSDHGITSDLFTVEHLRGYGRAVAETPRPVGDSIAFKPLSWTAFASIGAKPAGGPPFGVWKPWPNSVDWIQLTPTEGEGRDEWFARSEPLKARAEAFVEDVQGKAALYVQELGAAEAAVDAFRASRTPALIEALDRIREMAPPRVKKGCPGCR